MQSDDEVLFSTKSGVGGDLGIITLNRPHVLNCLNDKMVVALFQQLHVWQQDDAIKGVIIRAVPGRAFCAGGDLRLTYELAKKQDPRLDQFFLDEFRLNRYIFHFTKPYIAFLDGITMGGGVGIAIHGSHRVATERMTFAMPETAIGFFPDIGANYFLPRLVGKLGWYLGLTGNTISCDDAVLIGLAQHKVQSEKLDDLLIALSQTDFGALPKTTVSKVISEFETSCSYSPLLAAQAAVDTCFTAETMEEIIAKLSVSSEPLCVSAANTLNTRSPTSLKVTLRALLDGRQADFDTCMQHTHQIAYHFLQNRDFIEGIRAVIIDKDQAPRWQPATLGEVTEKHVSAYFQNVNNLPKL